MQKTLFIALLALLVSCSSHRSDTEQSKTIQKILLKTDEKSSNTDVNFRLVIKHGSLSEKDDERGFAHFVEHMAFNDTTKYPNESLVPLLEKSGFSLGAHSNAATHFDKTIYRINLKEPDAEQLEIVIDILSQWAMHVQFNQATVDAEKPIIKEEWRANQPQEKSWVKQHLKAQYANSHYLNRLPIGDMSMIESASADDLSSLYKRLYQPQNTAVIVTGNIDTKQLNTLIDKYFGEWKTTNQSTIVNYNISTQSIPKIQVISDDDVGSSFANLSYYLTMPKRETLDDVYQTMVSSAALNILEQRMKARIQDSKGAVTDFYTYSQNLTSTVVKVGLGTRLSGGDISTGLQMISSQLNQLLQQGVTQTELNNWREAALKNSRLHKESSLDLAVTATDHFVNGTPLFKHSDWLTILEKRLPAITTKQVNDSLRDRLNQQQAKLLVVHNPSITPPSKNELLAKVDTIKVPQAPIKDLTTATDIEAEWTINPDTKGELIQTSRFANGLVEWKFSNNTSVVFKKNDSEPGKVFYALSDEHGSRYLNEEQSIHARLALETLAGSGLRNMNGPELGQWLQNAGMSLQPYYTFWNKGVSGDTPTKDFSTMMNLLHISLTEAQVSSSTRSHFLEQNKTLLKQRENNVATPWQDAVMKLLYQNDAAFRVLTVDEVESTSVLNMEALYKQFYAGAQQYRLVIAGDIEEETVLQTVLGTIATLPKSPLTTAEPRDFTRISTPQVTKVTGSGRKAATISHKMTLAKSDLESINFTEVSYLHLWLRSALLTELREKEGLVYSVNVMIEGGFKDLKDYTLTIEMNCDPEKVDTLIAKLKEALQQQAAIPVTKEQLAVWVKESQSNLKAGLENPNKFVFEMNSAPLTGVALEDLTNVELRTQLADPKKLNQSLGAFLSDSAISTTLIWMP